MDSRRYDTEFSPAWIYRLQDRIRSRYRRFVSNSMEDKWINRKERTWTSSCLANIVKMRHRMKYPLQAPARMGEWESLIAFQKRKWAQRLDPNAAWAQVEYRLLDKMNAHRFPAHKEQGSTWAYVVNVLTTLTRRRWQKTERRTRLRRKWVAVFWNLGAKMRFRYEQEKDNDREWNLAIHGAREHARSIHWDTGWGHVAVNSPHERRFDSRASERVNARRA